MNVDPRTNYTARVAIGLLVVLVVVGVGGGYTYSVTADQVREQQRTVLKGEANSHQDLLDATIAGLYEDTGSVATTVAGLEPAIRDSILRQRASRSDRTVRLMYVDNETGVVESSSDGVNVGERLAEQGYRVPREALRNGETAVTYRDDDTDPTWAVFAPTGEGGWVVREFAVVDLVGEISPIVAGSNTRVVNDRGVVVLDTSNPSAMGSQHVQGDGVNSPAVSAALATEMGSNGVTSVPPGRSSSGERIVVGYQRLSTVDWAVVTYAPQREAFGVARSVGNNVLALLGAVGLALAVFALVVERPTVRALDRLAATARRFEDGELGESVESDREDQIGEVFTALDGMRASLRDRIAEAERARSEAEDARQETAALNERLETKAAEYEAVLSSVADGDLTARVDPDSDHEVISSLGENVNRTIDALEATLRAVSEAAGTVEQSSDDVTVGAEELDRANQDINESVQEISAGADRQNESLREVATEMNDLSASVEEIASTADEVAEVVEDAARRGQAGQDAAGDAIDEMRRIERTTGTTVAEIETLAEKMDRIGTMAEVIEDIAEQTNVLALNASIEAARAGEAGEGFAVVAEEIKELAAETAEATQEIEGVVEELQTETETAVADMRRMQDSVEEGTETVEEALDALEAIVDRVDDSRSGVDSIAAATDDQAASTAEVVTMVDDVTEVSDRNSARADNVAASVEEQTAATSELSETAENLAAVAARLNERLATFELAEEDGEDLLEGDEPEATEGTTGSDGIDAADGRDEGGDGGTPDGDAVAGDSSSTAEPTEDPDEAEVSSEEPGDDQAESAESTPGEE